MKRWTVAELLRVTAQYLQEKGSDSPRLDAELLLAHVLETPRISLYTGHDRPLEQTELDRYRELVARRAHREPVAYILGRAHFRYLELEVGPGVLVPRPETEELVDAVLEWLRLHPVFEDGMRVADVGAGSGAIALSLAREAGVKVRALDNSPEALEYVRRNRARAGLEELVEVAEGELLGPVPDGSLRVVVSNPPYVADREYQGLEPDVRGFEPPGALRGGPDGLDLIRRLVPEAARALGPGGGLFLEIGPGQGEEVAGLLEAAGFGGIEVISDLAGRPRVAQGQRPGAPEQSIRELLATDGCTRLSSALDDGALIGLPTDTVYGLACGWRSTVGVRRLFEAKGRPGERPVAVLFPSVRAVLASLPDIGAAAAAVLERLLPGPYTFVVSTQVERPPLVGTEDSLGVRVPEHEGVLEVLGFLGTPVAATSANRSGEPDPLYLAQVGMGVRSWCAAVIGDDGSETRGAASTVVDLRPVDEGREPEVLREGAVAAVEVAALIREAVEGS